VAEELDWGPKRPPAVSWAGSLLLLAGVAQLGALGTASLLDGRALLGGQGARIVTASVAGLLALQVLAAVGVLRLWRWWRGIAMALCLLGAALQGASLAPPTEPLPVLAINAALALAYLLVFTLLARSRDAFA
jgi:hypothetical protein